MFLGFVPLETSDFAVMLTTVNGSDTPTAPDSAASWRIYAPASTSVILSGSFSGTQVDAVNAPQMYEASSIAVTSANGFVAGGVYHFRAQYAISSTNFVKEGTFVVT